MSTIKFLHIIKHRAHPIATFMTEEFIKGAVIEKKCQSNLFAGLFKKMGSTHQWP
jgi:hypothetical protein